ncbi:uncharacterized protein LOC136768407 isoform X2 [Amia ocellicauda]|uniref:uncharacterized protein LOC136768407 isoform X2 n=1 Tax=Amia ocellicauda TaxID=2972642 RepID=UPI003464958D
MDSSGERRRTRRTAARPARRGQDGAVGGGEKGRSRRRSVSTARGPGAPESGMGPTPEQRGTSLGFLGPCGHSVQPGEVVTLVKTCLDKESLDLQCPLCGAQWEWREIRDLKGLPESELSALEVRVEQLVQCRPDLYKMCPSCAHILKRASESTGTPRLYTQCPRCAPHLFCWECHSPWGAPDSTCPNASCAVVATLLSCPTVTDPLSQVRGCPLFRACPKCHALILHHSGCKYVCCKSCFYNFCFICLESSKKCREAKELYFSLKCKKPRAARQTF